MCEFQGCNEEPHSCHMKALTHCFLLIRSNRQTDKTRLSTCYIEMQVFSVTADNISVALKMATTALHCPRLNGITFDHIDTNSLCSDRANALAFSVYSDMQIQMMGWWWEKFQEHIWEGGELALHCNKHCDQAQTISWPQQPLSDKVLQLKCQKGVNDRTSTAGIMSLGSCSFLQYRIFFMPQYWHTPDT